MLFLGSRSGPHPVPDWIVFGGQTNAFFGAAVASAGDVNGDGFSDVIIGAPYLGKERRGQALIFLGSPNGLSTNSGMDCGWPSSSSRFGASVALRRRFEPRRFR